MEHVSISPSRDRWLDAMWPVVLEQLPAVPAGALEIGCGAAGGFVPMLEAEGYGAVGVDPEAPDGPQFVQGRFEEAELPGPFDVVVACTSLHHVDDPAAVVDRIADVLRSDGRLIVVEWAWEELDEATASWCFERLDDDEHGWIHARREYWQASGLPWDDALRAWAQEHGIHRAADLVAELDRRFEGVRLARGPYCFSGLAGTSPRNEQAAIDAGLIRATRIDYVAVPRARA
jgi:SAM-dependent methyltransferase